MKGSLFRTAASALALLALVVASSPQLQAAHANSVASTAMHTGASASGTVEAIEQPVATGRGGWGSMIACAACAVGAGFTIAAGPAALLVAVNAPGSAVALMACTAACYEAFQ